MEKEFIPYEQALELKELGAYIECFGFYWFNGSSNRWVLETKEYESDYTKTISAPTFSQAFRFFREKYSLSGNVDCCDKLCEWDIKSSKLDKSIFSNKIQSYEEAELECLKKLISIVK